MKWKLMNESSNDEVKELLLKAMEIASPKVKEALQEVVDKYLNIPNYKGRELDTWREGVDTLKSTLPDMGEEGETDYDNQVEMIDHLRSSKPDFVYWYYSGNEDDDWGDIADKLRSDYPEYDVRDEVWWSDSTRTDCGFISMYKRK